MDVRADVGLRFPVDVAQHRMEVIRSEGVNRHLRFRKPGTGCMGFDIITWPGHLCFTGDMGTYVFSRITDMFDFFRSDGGKINPSYWSEKVLAADRSDGIERFSPERFRAAILQRLVDAEASPAVRAAAREEVLPAASDGEYAAFDAAHRFEHDGFTFTDFWEANCRDYSYRFIWCCHALVWSIAQFSVPSTMHGESSAPTTAGNK